MINDEEEGEISSFEIFFPGLSFCLSKNRESSEKCDKIWCACLAEKASGGGELLWGDSTFIGRWTHLLEVTLLVGRGICGQRTATDWSWCWGKTMVCWKHSRHLTKVANEADVSTCRLCEVLFFCKSFAVLTRPKFAKLLMCAVFVPLRLDRFLLRLMIDEAEWCTTSFVGRELFCGRNSRVAHSAATLNGRVGNVSDVFSPSSSFGCKSKDSRGFGTRKKSVHSSWEKDSQTQEGSMVFWEGLSILALTDRWPVLFTASLTGFGLLGLFVFAF